MDIAGELNKSKKGELKRDLQILERKENMRPPKIFVIGDTHFGHNNVIKYSGRPFTDSAEMDRQLIKNWNATVAKQDIVYMIGDFTLSGNKAYIAEIVAQLNGKIILVMGNHDRLKPHQYIKCGFYSAIRKPVMVEPKVMLMHEPPLESDMVDGIIYIFGHVHEKIHPVERFDNTRCACVERINYKPIELETLKLPK